MSLFASRRVLVGIAFSLLVCRPVAAQPAYPVAPIGVGPFPVACSNIEQDFSRVQPGETADDYWEGIPRDGQSRYVTDLLVDPANALQLPVRIPDDPDLFPDRSGQTFPYVVVVCYPTDSSNPRADFVLPGGGVVPRMQRGDEAPIWPETLAPARWPLLVYAHGLNGSPLGGGYLETVALFATHGYVVAAPFFADARFSLTKIEDAGDLLYLATHLTEVVELQGVRPVSGSAMLDYLLVHPHYRDHIDAARIGGFGGSMGGETLMLMAGAKLTVSLGLSSKAVITDPRLRAIVGYVPYFGRRLIPAFGDDQSGLDGLTVPTMTIAGTADDTAPIEMVEQGVNRLSGARYLVALEGAEHGLDPAHVGDVFTWSLTFLDAYLTDGKAARVQIATMTEVTGGADDSTRIDYTPPLPATGAETEVVEYYNPQLDHYFVTGFPEEAAMLDTGVLVSGWRRTGTNLKGFVSGSGEGFPVCRFFGTDRYRADGSRIGPDSHFYTADAAECEYVKTAWQSVADDGVSYPAWQFEGIAFDEQTPIAERCPLNRVPVYRIYNDGRGGQANHRYTTSRQIVADMQRWGWVLEGAVFCAPP